MTEIVGNSVADTRDVLAIIDSILTTLADTISDGLFPEIGYFGSSKKNIEYSKLEGYTHIDAAPSYLDGRKVESAKTIAGLVYGLTRFKEHLEQGMSMSLRDYYYMHKVKRVQALFKIGSQNETNRAINLCERIIRSKGASIPREDFGVVSSPKGTFYGDVTLSDLSGKIINCTRAGEYGWFISSRPFEVRIHDINVDAAVFVEKEAMARNLIELGIPEDMKLGVGSLFGQPGRNMRAWIRRLADAKVPVLVLVDMSPWSLRIFSTIKNNSIELANIRGLSTPEALLIGLTIDDFWHKKGMLKEIEHSLEVMSNSDIKCARQNQSIPAICQDKMLIRENNTMLRKKRKGELEAFKAFGLPLNQLKTTYMKYIQAKARNNDVKLI
jgi:DNA topoisomerase VI subunit A